MKKFTVLAAVAAVLGLASCSNNDDLEAAKQPTTTAVEITASQTASVKMASNGVYLASQEGLGVTTELVKVESTDGASAETLAAAKKVFTDVVPEEHDNIDATGEKEGVSNFAKDYVYVSDGEPITVYVAGCGTGAKDIVSVYWYDAEGEKHTKEIFRNYNNKNQIIWGAGSALDQIKGIKITVAKGVKYGFAIQQNYGSYIDGPYYSNVNENEDYCTEDKCWGKGCHSITFAYGEKTYFGFEDWQHATPNYDLNDIIFVMDKKVDVIPDPEPDDVELSDGSVEVNLATNDSYINAAGQEEKGVASHLSVHVRTASDFSLFIPVEAEYYCPSDDMMIVAKHDVAYAYNEKTESVTYNINGNEVTLNVTYGEKGITISSKGMNEKVLEYLTATYGDGLTFEVRNYFNSTVTDAEGNTKAFTHADLKEKLANSTITFDKLPKQYLQAIGKKKVNDAEGNETYEEDTNAVKVKLADAMTSKYEAAGDSKEFSDNTTHSTLYIFNRK